MAHSQHWLNGAVLYQIYPRSFYDSNGDGIGDLRGIQEKLSYLRGEPDSLGVDYIWLSPFYPSPMADFGYDVTNYTDVDPIFGNLHDFRALLAEAHKRELKVLIDFIPNHTSDEHEWFKQSHSSRDNPKRDWYVWRDGKPNGDPPNNWISVFGGSAWQYDETTGQYYLHSFLSKQPDLNWENQEVREAMHAQLKFWLDMGVDGFRFDAVSWISKDPELKDEVPNDGLHGEATNPHDTLLHTYSQNGPYLYTYLNEMAELIGTYGEKIMLTEAYPQTWNDISAYRKFYDNVNPAVSAPFNFSGIFAEWDAETFRTVIDTFQTSLKPSDLPVYCLGNHDRARLVSRVGNEAAKTAAVLLLTLPGMPTIYYGDELGLPSNVIPPEYIQDPFEKNVPGQGNGRDPSRTPMLWNSQQYAGFSAVTPWLPIHDSYQAFSVESQRADPNSFLQIYRELLRIRASSDALKTGSYHSLETPLGVYGFVRESDGEMITVFLNFTGQTIDFDLSLAQHTCIFSTHTSVGTSITGHVSLAAHEGMVLQRR